VYSILRDAEVSELADEQDSGSCERYAREGCIYEDAVFHWKWSWSPEKTNFKKFEKRYWRITKQVLY